MSRSWSSAHDWKSCKGQKLFESSNLSILTIRWGIFFISGWRDSNHVRTCRWHVYRPVQKLVDTIIRFARPPQGKTGCMRISPSPPKPENHPSGWFFFFARLRERFEKGTSAARETCRGHVSMPVCVPARCPRRANLSISARTGLLFQQDSNPVFSPNIVGLSMMCYNVGKRRKSLFR